MGEQASKPRRIVTRLLVFSLLLTGGAIVNVAVAWGCVLWVSPARANYQFGVDRSQPQLWTLARFDAFGTTLLFSDRGPDHGDSVPSTGAAPRELAPVWSELIEAPPEVVGQPVSGEYRIADGRGWPLRALSLQAIALRWENPPGWTSSKRWMIDLDPSESAPIDWNGWAIFRWLPLRPIWPGFAINTIFYAAILWLLWAAPGAIRRRRRKQRGLCIHCGYDLRGAAPDSPNCPECGAARARLESRQLSS